MSRDGGDWGGRRPSGEGYEQPEGASGPNSKRVSLLEDLLEEDDGEERGRFGSFRGRY